MYFNNSGSVCSVQLFYCSCACQLFSGDGDEYQIINTVENVSLYQWVICEIKGKGVFLFLIIPYS